MINDNRIVVINGWKFRDVTNITTSKKTYNYEEALALTRGEIIATGSNKRIDEK